MRLAIVFSIILLSNSINAQKYTIEKSLVTFFSESAIEDIKSENRKSAGLYNPATGNIALSIPIRHFKFEKSLMYEHFNEKYLETEKFPRATFQGSLTRSDATLVSNQVVAKGKLTIHGITNDVAIHGTLENAKDKILMNATFVVKLETYNIEIPQLLWQNIAEQVEVNIEATFKPQ